MRADKSRFGEEPWLLQIDRRRGLFRPRSDQVGSVKIGDSEIAPGGIGLRPFNPLSLAIAAGANFVARGFSGDPRGLASLIVEGIRWPGFAFIEVLSPCITFRPEQFDWKKKVRQQGNTIENDRAAATAAVLADDGFSLGIFFKGDRATVSIAVKPATEVADIERQFAIDN